MKETIGHYLLSERSLNNTAAGLAGVDAPPDPPLPVRAMGEQSRDYEALPWMACARSWRTSLTRRVH